MEKAQEDGDLDANMPRLEKLIAQHQDRAYELAQLQYRARMVREESNAENLLVIRSAEIAARYERNYQEHLAHSVKYERREEG